MEITTSNEVEYMTSRSRILKSISRHLAHIAYTSSTQNDNLPILTSSDPGGPPMVFKDDVLKKIDYASGKGDR